MEGVTLGMCMRPPHYGMSFHVGWLLLVAFSDSHVALETARCLAAVKDDG